MFNVFLSLKRLNKLICDTDTPVIYIKYYRFIDFKYLSNPPSPPSRVHQGILFCKPSVPLFGIYLIKKLLYYSYSVYI